jgi:hypothetical protein
MSFDDDDDWRRDDYEMEIGSQAVEQFQTERLQSFYKEHKDLALKPIRMAKEARSVFEQSPSAALVLAVVSIEVGFKAIILRPIISGLVHEESLASLITEMFVKNTKQDGVLKVVDQVLRKYASIDLKGIILPTHAQSYLSEVTEAQELRNGILHRAEMGSKEDAQRIIELAEYLWNVIFLEIIKSIGLHTHDRQTVCDQYEGACEARARIEEMEQRGELSIARRVREAVKK